MSANSRLVGGGGCINKHRVSVSKNIVELRRPILTTDKIERKKEAKAQSSSKHRLSGGACSLIRPACVYFYMEKTDSELIDQ